MTVNTASLAHFLFAANFDSRHKVCQWYLRNIKNVMINSHHVSPFLSWVFSRAATSALWVSRSAAPPSAIFPLTSPKALWEKERHWLGSCWPGCSLRTGGIFGNVCYVTVHCSSLQNNLIWPIIFMPHESESKYLYFNTFIWKRVIHRLVAEYLNELLRGLDFPTTSFNFRPSRQFGFSIDKKAKSIVYTIWWIGEELMH